MQIFEKLIRRGRLNPVQNAMSDQVTNEQLLRFYVEETVPKLQCNNDDIQGQGGDTNSVLMSEIQRLIDVGNFNAQDAKNTMTTMQTKLINDGRTLAQINIDDALNRNKDLITQLQRGFNSVNDSIADNLSFVKTTIDDIADNLTISSSTNDASSQNIIKSLNDLNTNLEQYNTTGTVSQGALFTSLANLQTALANSNTNNVANTTAIDNLSIIMGSMSGTPGVGVGVGGTAPPTPPSPPVPVLPPTPPVLPPAPVSPVLPPVLPPAPTSPVLPSIPSGLIPLLPPPPAPGAAAIEAVALAVGSPIMTTSTTTGMQTLVTPTPNIAPLAGAKGGADTVMVTGKVPLPMGIYPEYEEVKAKNGNKPLVGKDYRAILEQIAVDFPKWFEEGLKETNTKKISTYINKLTVLEQAGLTDKLLAKKYEFKDATTKLQEVSARSLSSREYGKQISSATLIQNALRGRDARAELRQLKYQALANATALKQQQSSATRVQTQFRSHLARQEYARQQLAGVPFVANPTLYPLFPGAGTPLGDVSIVSQEDFNSWLDTFGP